MHCCQPLILIFQFFKIFEQRTSTPLSLNPSSVLVYIFDSHRLDTTISHNLYGYYKTVYLHRSLKPM